ncbi:MAG: hypothetical protein LBP54_01085 [Campylobacteraceae bacterium]|jgi:Sec-independent protein translocase protein TatA|nr:hypothetical protein [Campylobacteraceae bacterium]
MALPIFIAGIAVGGLAVVAFNNREKIAGELQKGVKQAKKTVRKELDEAFKFAEKVKQELKPQKPKRAQSKKRKTTIKEDNNNAS